ncbi:MAG: bifunctional 2',3'-cyclic-nucleotide 2'-phosphodiesterase/3'-nucleotidase [Burkholderiales bacterium]|nr:bifunctional 2',3'-cyclic-nucleotide 2'-phosphodiesterase/3'-nucleotidase [Burkholderiales bacterium]
MKRSFALPPPLPRAPRAAPPADRRFAGLAALVALLALLALLGPGAARAQQLDLRLLETTDVHMNLLAYDYYEDKPVDSYGLDRTATLIARARAEVRNSLLFDDGDMLQGSPLGDYVARIRPLQPGQLHPAIRVINALHYDAANIGNHEFNYGLPFLRQALAGSDFPWVDANLVVDDGQGRPASAPPAFTPYVILQRRFVDRSGQAHTLKVGVVGFAPPQVMQWDRENLQGRLQALDIPATARRLVPLMRAAGADIVVVLAHSGLERSAHTPPMAENTVARLAEVPGVTAILFGHSHGEFPGPFFAGYAHVDLTAGSIDGVPATMAGFWGSHLGVIDLVLDKGTDGWRVASAHAELRPVYDRREHRALAAPDPAIARLVQAEHAGTIAAMGVPVTRSTAPLDSYFAQVRDDPSVQVVADAQLAYGRQLLAGTPYAGLPLLSAAAPFKSGARGTGGGGGYTDIPAGPIALRDVASLYVYPNTVKIVRLTGAQVREWLEFAVGAFNRIDPHGPPAQSLLNPAFPSFNFDTLDGVQYAIDLTQPARYDRSGQLVAPDAHRIVGLRWQGRPIDERGYFAIVTNNYRAAGGGNFPGLDGSNIIVNAPEENREALVDYLKTQQPLQPQADGNWRLQPVPGVKLRFVSGAGAIARLAQAPQVRLVRDNGDGSALFELTP